MPFTSAEITDIRRYCGYPVATSRGFVYDRTFEIAVSNMTDTEMSVVRTTYLPNLASLETAILGTSDNLDTSEAAVWKHNQYEHTDRCALFDDWRRRLCSFIGVDGGPDLSGKQSVVRT